VGAPGIQTGRDRVSFAGDLSIVKKRNIGVLPFLDNVIVDMGYAELLGPGPIKVLAMSGL
jgi:hypothetical protein